jgi:HrpA-like RNA helicase
LFAFREFLDRALEPPPSVAIVQSVENLVELGALDRQENLTPLGCHLALLPVAANIGKMMLFGAMFRCVSPVLTICAVLSTRTPFVSSLENRDDADAVKKEFDEKTRSDHLTVLRAYEGWCEAKKDGRDAESNFCWENYLSKSALWTIQETRRHLKRQLKDIGFISGNHDADNANVDNLKLLRAVICAGLYPNVVRIDSIHNKDGVVTGVRFKTKAEEVSIHPTSVNAQVKSFPTKWLVYHEKIKTTKIYIRDSTLIGNYALLLFGGEIKIDHQKQELSIDQWMRFDAPVKVGVLINKLRRELDRIMLNKIEDPREDISKSKVVNAILQLLSSEHMASAK